MTLAVRASQTLTSSGTNVSDADTCTIGSKVYTFQTSLTNVDGNVKIGASASATLDNLKAAINLGSGAGTTYATAMTLHPSARATTKTSTTLVVKAKVPGVAGNLINTSKSAATLSWGSTVMASGAGDPAVDLAELTSGLQLNADAAQRIADLLDADGTA